MHKFFVRIIAILLLACLTTNRATAGGLCTAFQRSNLHSGDEEGFFACQAFSVRALAPYRVTFAKALASGIDRLAGEATVRREITPRLVRREYDGLLSGFSILGHFKVPMFIGASSGAGNIQLIWTIVGAVSILVIWFIVRGRMSTKSAQAKGPKPIIHLIANLREAPDYLFPNMPKSYRKTHLWGHSENVERALHDIKTYSPETLAVIIHAMPKLGGDKLIKMILSEYPGTKLLLQAPDFTMARLLEIEFAEQRDRVFVMVRGEVGEYTTKPTAALAAFMMGESLHAFKLPPVKPIILIVDDEEEWIAETKRSLIAAGYDKNYDLLGVDSSKTALYYFERFKKEGIPVALLITDLNLRDHESGRELSNEVLVKYPEIKIILQTSTEYPGGLTDLEKLFAAHRDRMGIASKNWTGPYEELARLLPKVTNIVILIAALLFQSLWLDSARDFQHHSRQAA